MVDERPPLTVRQGQERGNPEIAAFLHLLVHADLDLLGEACIMWPFGLDRPDGTGYGIINRGGTRRVGHLVMIARGRQRPAPPAHWMLHSCDNPPCVNPRHLRWGTPTDNRRDAVDRGRATGGSRPGERNSNAKLTAAAVAAIRFRLAQGERQGRIAADFGISQQAVSGIKRGQRWLTAQH